MAAAHSEDLCHPGNIIKARWTIIEKYRVGGFGQLFTAKDNRMNNEIVAVKVESNLKRNKCQLPMELYVLKEFQVSPHSVALYGAGTHNKIHYIAMRLIGPDLARLRRMMKDPCTFSMATTLKIGVQFIDAICDLHDLAILHRDIKPSNIAMGPMQHAVDKNIIYLIDFGLARVQFNPDGTLRPDPNSGTFRGTKRYCSINAHRRQDVGRNDDMISFFYTMVEFLVGCLPWRDLETHLAIMASKDEYNLLKLAQSRGLPDQFASIARHLLMLSKLDEPNYTYIKDLLNSIATERDISFTEEWDWNKPELLRPNPQMVVDKSTTSLHRI